MNTGIGDAVNLAWKLAAVLGGRADPVLLDSYEAERIPFARSLVRDDRPGVRGRRRPGAVLPAGPARLRPVHPAARLAVRGRPAGAVPARLPDPDRLPGEPAERRVGGRGPRRRPAAVGRGGRQLRPARVARLAGPRLRRGPAVLRGFAAGVGLPLHEWPWTQAARRAGLEQDAMYLVRPDGHVGFARGEPEVEGLRAYLGRFGGVAAGGDRGERARGPDHAA